MPYKCCVPGCRGNYLSGPKVHVFGFPRDDLLCKRWLASIPRANFQPNKNSKVCELHFVSDNIIWNICQQDSKTGKIVSCNLKIPRLKENSTPTKFPNCPEYLSKHIKIRKSRDGKLKDLDEVHFLQAIEESKQEYLAHKKNTSYQNFNEFTDVFQSFNIPQGWFTLNNDAKITIFILEYIPGPSITWAVVIDDKLQIDTFLYGQSVNITVNKLNTPFVSNSLDEIKDLLNTIDISMMTISLDNSNNNNNDTLATDSDKLKHILKFMANILDNLKVEEPMAQGLNFISEQLQLHTTAKERYYYLYYISIL